MTSDTTGPASTGGAVAGAGTIVRRIVLFVILYTLVVVAAIGLSGLIERVIGADRFIVDDDAGLARALAFTFIGIPLAAVLWWWQRRRLADRGERASLVWALYLTAMSLTSLIVATVLLATVAGAGIDGEWRPGDLSGAIVWTGVWLWHRHMRRSPVTAPTRLPDLPIELGALWGLVIAAGGGIVALTGLISQALDGFGALLVISQLWFRPVLQALVWCVLGLLIWWWHWSRERANAAPGRFAAVLLVIVVGAAAATTLFALGTVLYAVLRLLFDSEQFGGSGRVPDILAPLDVAIASGLVGGLVWVYHSGVLATRSDATRRAGRLVISAIALIGAASGFGIVVNAILATLAPVLVEEDPRTLLLGGVSALVIGGPAWWLAWRPDRSSPADAADPARRVYLVAVFGASAIVAVVTLLLIGYRVFEFALGAGGAGSLVERVRAPLGLLSATAIVFGYHFAVWRRDRAAAPKAPKREIGRIILITSGDSGEQVAGIRAATGAAVTVWTPADDALRLGADEVASALQSLEGVAAARVVVVAEPGGGVRVIPLAD